MRIAYFDCFCGISGDMCLGALIHAGLDPQFLTQHLQEAGIPDFALEVQKVNLQGVGATEIQVVSRESPPPLRTWREIKDFLQKARLLPKVKEKSLAIFTRLAEAEAQIHQIPPEKVHFHEIGALDTLVDIIGTVMGLEQLGVEQIYASALPFGQGPVVCAHGTLPNPTPATLALCQNTPLYFLPIEGELVTPTGAAIITTLANSFGAFPPYKLSAVGYGAGSKRFVQRPNFLRLCLGQKENEADLPSAFPRSAPSDSPSLSKAPTGYQTQYVWVLETAVDDLQPEGLGYLRERLEAAEALEVLFRSVSMKKGRPGTELTVLALENSLPELISIIFQESTTLGLRLRQEKRLFLPRFFQPVSTPFGAVPVKWTWRPKTNSADWYLTGKPEFESCRKIAQEQGQTLQEVWAVVQKSILPILSIKNEKPE